MNLLKQCLQETKGLYKSEERNVVLHTVLSLPFLLKDEEQDEDYFDYALTHCHDIQFSLLLLMCIP